MPWIGFALSLLGVIILSYTLSASQVLGVMLIACGAAVTLAEYFPSPKQK